MSYGQYFTPDEFRCKHTGDLPPDSGSWQEFLDTLNRIRKQYGAPLKVNSGFRAASHPVEATKPNGPGAHNTHGAADIAVAWQRHPLVIERFLAIALDDPLIAGIGLNLKGDWSQRFIHLDTMPRNRTGEITFWSY